MKKTFHEQAGEFGDAMRAFGRAIGEATRITRLFDRASTSFQSGGVVLPERSLARLRETPPPDPLGRKVPCSWIFRSDSCGYTGVASCNKTFDNCRALGNEARFNGFDPPEDHTNLEGVDMAISGEVILPRNTQAQSIPAHLLKAVKENRIGKFGITYVMTLDRDYQRMSREFFSIEVSRCPVNLDINLFVGYFPLFEPVIGSYDDYKDLNYDDIPLPEYSIILNQDGSFEARLNGAKPKLNREGRKPRVCKREGIDDNSQNVNDNER